MRALDEAGLTVEALDLVEPSLDDVFLAKTGHHLEARTTEADGAGRHPGGNRGRRTSG